MSATAEPAPTRRPYRRWRLFLPFAVLLALAVLWSIGWLVLRGRAEAFVDAWFAREREAGRAWSCPDRSIGGYPFRFEVVCPSLAFERADFAWRTGRVVAVAQVYQPSLVIVEAAGPFEVSRGPLTAKVAWSLLQASLHLSGPRVQRFSLSVDGLSGSANAGADPVAFTAKHIEFHGRPNPGRFADEGAVDVNLRAEAASVPALDPLLGGPEPAEVALDATASRAAGFGGRPMPVELERWRRDGGAIDLTLLSIAKGPRRLRLKGNLMLDEGHRVAGRLDAEAAGLEAVIGPLLGQRIGGDRGALVGNLIGGLLGGVMRPPRDAAPRIDQAPAQPNDGPRLAPLPPVVLADGRVRLGPFPIPVMLLPLY